MNDDESERIIRGMQINFVNELADEETVELLEDEGLVQYHE